MAISKHPRKSGATTIKRDGKIVGNIGRGKTKVPTIQNSPIQRLNTIEDETSTVCSAQQKMDSLSQKVIGFEQAQTLWNLTADKNVVERFNILSNYIDIMQPSDRERLLIDIETQPETQPEQAAMDVILSGRSRYGDVSPNILDACAQYSGNEWKKAVAGNRNTTPQTLDRLADCEDPWLLMRVAKNPHTLPATLEKIFAKTQHAEALCEVAGNENTPLELLEKLIVLERSINSRHRIIASAVLYNPKYNSGKA